MTSMEESEGMALVRLALSLFTEASGSELSDRPRGYVMGKLGSRKVGFPRGIPARESADYRATRKKVNSMLRRRGESRGYLPTAKILQLFGVGEDWKSIKLGP